MQNILMCLMSLDIGGAETHVIELSKALKRRGYNIVIASNGGVYEKELETVGIKHYSVPLQNKNPKNVMKAFSELEKIIKDENIDIVHSHARIPGFILGQLHKKLKFPFVTTAHWVFSTKYGLKYITNWGEKTIAVSEDIKKYLLDNYKIKEENITVTINGIDTEKFTPDNKGEKVRQELGLTDEPVVVYVSRMDEDRSLVAHQLIEAVGSLDGVIENLNAVIVGGGNDFENVKIEAVAMNKKLGRKAIHITGARTDIADLVAAGELFVGVSRAALEAMSAGKCTIIAGNEGYIGIMSEERFDIAYSTNFCCRGCEESTSKKIASDIGRYFGMWDDDKEALCKYSRQLILDRYSVDKMTDDVEGVYKELMSERKDTKK